MIQSKFFRLVSVLMLLSMVIVPASAKSITAPGAGNDKLELQAADPSSITMMQSAAIRGVVDEIKGATEPARYIIVLQEPALALYKGGIAGLKATNPEALGTNRLDVHSADSQAYVAYLEGQQASFLAKISQGLSRTVAAEDQMFHAINAIVLTMTPAEAAQVATLPEVYMVQRDVENELDTDVGPTWIGAAGIWDGTATGVASQGETIVAGILDTGINVLANTYNGTPLNIHPSFADPGPDDGYVYPAWAGPYFGVCNPASGDYDATFPCNDKLIGAYDMMNNPSDPNAPRDDNGHGSHTASTVAGNTLNHATVDAPTLSYEPPMISGVAPHARIIAYDVCYTNASGQGACPTSATTAAANKAVADGVVNVINYSISGGESPWSDSTSLAFLGCRGAGIYVATSAGNSGPGSSTVGHHEPWVTNTAAATHNRRAFKTLSDMAGGSTTPPGTITGAGFTAGYSSHPIVYAGNFGDPLCGTPFPANTWINGEIVLCDRGIYARVDKAINVAAGGAGGFILANDVNSGASLTSDPYVIPGIHITYADGVAVKTWLASGTGHVGTISATVFNFDPANGDVMAAFSSRGPAAGNLNLLKPDVAAPGVNIMAAVHTAGTFSFMDGTSMASPHNAGSAALLMDLHPDWTPAEVQSALMTTGFPGLLKEDGISPTTPFDRGAGRLQVSQAANAGFVLNETVANYQAANPASGGDPRTLNQASLADSSCMNSCSWTRTIRSTQSTAVDYTATGASGSGLNITVNPSSFTLAAGGTQTLVITANVGSATTGSWAFGQVNIVPTPIEDISEAHLTLAVIPVTGILPDMIKIDTRRSVGSEMVTGLQTFEITNFTDSAYGLTLADMTDLMLDVDPTNGDPYDNLNDGTVHFITVEIPADTARFVNETTFSEAEDIDLYVGFDANADGLPSAAEEICTSTTPQALEYCDVENPAAGTYWVVVQNWSASAEPPDLVKFATAVVPKTDAGNLTATGPTAVPAGEPFDIRVFFDTPSLMADERAYGTLILGTSPANPDNIGYIPVDIVRLEDDVIKTADPAVAQPGDTVDFTLTVNPNVLSEDLTYDLVDTLPDGLTLVPGSAAATGGTVAEVGNGITWTGTMAVPGVSYNYVTSIEEPNCAMPLANSGAYVDLEGYGVFPQSAIHGDTIWFSTNPPGGAFDFFGGSGGEVINFTDDGFAFFDPSTPGDEPWANTPLPTATEPNSLMAFFWRDLEVIYDAILVKGVSIANLTSSGNPVASVLEYDDVVDWGETTSYDVEMAIYYAASNAPYDYEIIFAYDNLNAGTTSLGTIGLENPSGTVGVQVGYDNLEIQDGMAICFDQILVGDEPVIITYQATVDAGTPPGILTNVATHTVDNPGSVEASASADVEVPSAPVAAFTPSTLFATVGEDVVFTNETTGTEPITYAWDFGDGGTSTGVSPTHAFAAVGDYLVTLTATNAFGEDTAEATIHVVEVLPEADLALQVTAAPNPVAPGGNLDLTLVVTNNGPDDATGVVIEDTLPAGVTFVEALDCTEAGGVVTCDVGALANGESATRTITVTAPDAEGELTNTATVSGDQLDPVADNNTVSTVITVGAAPEINIYLPTVSKNS